MNRHSADQELSLPPAVRSRAVILWGVGLAPLLASAVGSVFNIWYNLTQVRPLLTERQIEAFEAAIGRYNLTGYPLVGILWVAWVFSLHRAMAGRVEGAALNRARSRAINLPWINAIILGAGWLACVPYFYRAVREVPDAMHPEFLFHLFISVLIAAMITVTHAVFILELMTQKWLFPALFLESGSSPSKTPGAFTLTLGRRLLLWSISASICPIASLLLVMMAREGVSEQELGFALAVGMLGILFGLISAWMLGHLLADPLGQLRRSAARVAAGDLNTRVDLLRADEFGPLIDQFNHMIAEMRAKERLRQTFGQHVGQAAAEQILAADPGLGGRERCVTVLFCDLRRFTARSAGAPAQEVVWLLNDFFRRMVKIVEEDCGGLVNKFLGDGFMALFGAAGEEETAAACSAVRAAEGMRKELDVMNRELLACNREPLEMGTGIHTGPVIIGNIGSEKRLEYTAIGDAVNVASRLQEMTKELGCPLLISAQAAQRVDGRMSLISRGEHAIRGRKETFELFTTDGGKLLQSSQ